MKVDKKKESASNVLGLRRRIQMDKNDYNRKVRRISFSLKKKNAPVSVRIRNTENLKQDVLMFS